MKCNKSLFILSLIGCMFLCTFAFAAQWGDFSYTVSGTDNVTITGYTGVGGAVVIPDTINGLLVVSIDNSTFHSSTVLTSVTIPGSVTNIGSVAFYGCTGLTSIAVDSSNSNYSSQDGVLYNKTKTTLIQYPAGKTGGFIIPGSVTSIKYVAFYGCTGLTSVAFPSSLVSIGTYAFAECTGLTSVGTIPAGVTSIGEAVFSSCTGLTSITVDAGNPAYISQDGVLYNKDKTVLLQCPAGKAGFFAIPGSVTSIGAEAFRFCTKIKGLTIPEGVTSIGYRSCAHMYALTDVTIPASVTNIGEYGFFGGISNTGITVHPDNPNYSSLDGVLYNKDKTALIQYPCGRAGALIVPASVTSVGIAAFEMCTVVTSITFTGNVESIAESAFESATGLTIITFPGSLTNIVRWAFWGCIKLHRAYFYGNAPVLGAEVFDNCASDFTVYYLAESTGFTNPWYGYPAEVFDPSITTTTTSIEPSTTTTSVAPTTTTSIEQATTTTSAVPSTTTTTTSRLCPAKNVLGEDNRNLENLRAFRDSRLATCAVGRKVIQIYYNNIDSINAALESNPSLRALTRRVLEVIAPMVGNN